MPPDDPPIIPIGPIILPFPVRLRQVVAAARRAMRCRNVSGAWIVRHGRPVVVKLPRGA